MDWSALLTRLPPVMARKDVGKLLGGVISPKTLANADALGKGPANKFYSGRTVIYETISLLKWLDQR